MDINKSSGFRLLTEQSRLNFFEFIEDFFLQISSDIPQWIVGPIYSFGAQILCASFIPLFLVWGIEF